MNFEATNSLEESRPVSGKLINLRLLHLRECAQVWSEGSNIEHFIEVCNSTYNKDEEDGGIDFLDFRFQDPSNTELFNTEFKDQYWVQYMIAAGPKDPTKPVGQDNQYLFWREGIAPYYNPASSSAMVQPYINNRIIIKVPNKQKKCTQNGSEIKHGNEYLSGFEQTIALSIAAASDPAFFATKFTGNENLTYKSGANTMGDLALSEALFNIKTDLFIAHTGMYSLYFSKAYAAFRVLTKMPPINRHEPTQLIPELLAPGQPKKSFNLNNDTDGMYFSLSAGIRNLITMMWTENNLWELLVTKPEQLDAHIPGQTVKLINELLGTVYPLHFDLVLMEDKDAHFIFDEKGIGCWKWIYSDDFIMSLDKNSQTKIQAGVAYPNSKLPLQIIQYSIPHPPENESMAPIALMNYDVDDEGFPFTC